MFNMHYSTVPDKNLTNTNFRPDSVTQQDSSETTSQNFMLMTSTISPAV
jgi:hypothetical protein